MKKRVAYLATLVLSGSLTAFLTYYITRVAYVPAPIRVFHANRSVFEDYVALNTSQDEHDTVSETRLRGLLREVGVYHIHKEGDALFFVFESFVSDPVPEIGVLVSDGNPSFNAMKYWRGKWIYRWQIIEGKWFYILSE